MGIPAIASRTAAITGYFDDTMVRFVEPGSVQDLADAIVDLSADEAARDRLSTGIRAFAERHSHVQQARTYLRVVESLHEQVAR
jgi:hypothetical protein